MSNITAVIFDLDGTLIDSAPDIHAAANKALSALGRPGLDLPTIVSFIGAGVENLMTQCLNATGGSTPALLSETLAHFLKLYEADNATLTTLYPGVQDTLQQLREQGLKLGVCTNKVQGPALEICEKLGLTPFFDTIHGARTEVVKKPAPTMLFNCMADLKSDPTSSIYVGDSPIDHKTAHSAKVPFALFTGGYLNGPLEGPPPAVRFDSWSENWLSHFQAPDFS